MLSSFENFGFKENVENFPFWKTFCFENVVKVFRFGELSRNFKTTNYSNYHESFVPIVQVFTDFGSTSS